MNFEQILELMKKGFKAYRGGWNGIEAGITMYVFIKRNVQIQSDFHVASDPNENRRVYDIMNMDPFFIFYHENKGTYNAWMPSMWDIMADDWVMM